MKPNMNGTDIKLHHIIGLLCFVLLFNISRTSSLNRMHNGVLIKQISLRKIKALSPLITLLLKRKKAQTCIRAF
jgi:hypothetical protein